MVIRKTIIGTLLVLCVGLGIASYAGGEKKTNVSSSENVPEIFTLGRLAKIYEPVAFSHEAHTLMAEDCATCHHHSEAGQTPSCNKCHDASSASKESGIPGLKDAYHRLCMGCHREMEMGPTGCAECHAAKAVKVAQKAPVPVRKKAEKGPEILILGALEKRYEPVTFSHDMHTLMADDCATCHHHSEPGQTPGCHECHGAPFDPKNLNMPGLKGAYHLQCMGCHQEMDSGPVGCTECHGKKAGQKPAGDQK
jgi:predicted CXXCH cytochrome family protein